MEVVSGSHLGVILEVIGAQGPKHLGRRALDDLGRR
jgi:hypothetical protein